MTQGGRRVKKLFIAGLVFGGGYLAYKAFEALVIENPGCDDPPEDRYGSPFRDPNEEV